MGFYTLRYLPDVSLRDRKHAPTARQFETFEAAEDYRQALDAADRFEVVERGLPEQKLVGE